MLCFLLFRCFGVVSLETFSEASDQTAVGRTAVLEWNCEGPLQSDDSETHPARHDLITEW